MMPNTHPDSIWPGVAVKTLVNEEYGYPILEITDVAGQHWYYFPLVNHNHDPQLILGRPSWTLTKTHKVALFTPSVADALPYVLAVEER